MSWPLSGVLLNVARGSGSSVLSTTDLVADFIAGLSLVVSGISLIISWRSSRRVRVWFDVQQIPGDAHYWLVAVVRNPGGALVQITGWGVLGRHRWICRYKYLPAATAGNADLGAPDELPYDLSVSSEVRFSWENIEAKEKYKEQYGKEPKWVRAYIRVGWRPRKIKSRLPSRWP